MNEHRRTGWRISGEMAAIISVGIVLATLNVVMISELREAGRADRAAWVRESREAHSEWEKFAGEIARLTREGRHGPRRCRLTVDEVRDGMRCPR